MGLYLKHSVLIRCFLPISVTAATRSPERAAETLSQLQHEQLTRYIGSGHSRSSVLGSQGGGASDLVLHPMSTATRSPQCAAETVSQLQHERLTRHGDPGHSHSPVLGTRGGGACNERLHRTWRAPRRHLSIKSEVVWSVRLESAGCRSRTHRNGVVGRPRRRPRRSVVTCVGACACGNGVTGDLRSVPSALLVLFSRPHCSSLSRAAVSCALLVLSAPAC